SNSASSIVTTPLYNFAPPIVNANKGDKKKLLREFNDYLNHPHNSLGKSVFIKHVGLDKTDEVLGSEHLVAGGVLVAASWHPNNLRVGPEGALRSDEPTVIKTEYEIDRAVAGKDTRIEKILDNYVKQKDNNNVINILRTQNQLTNKVDQYGWSKIQNTKSSKPSYRVNDKQNIGKITKLFTRNRDDRRKFNIQTGISGIGLNCLGTWIRENRCKKWSQGLRFVQFQKNPCHHRVIKHSLFGHEPKIGLASTSLHPSIFDNIITEEELPDELDLQVADTNTTDKGLSGHEIEGSRKMRTERYARRKLHTANLAHG
ncbi:unnamed protein product, partial [Didymodactylos carnosus]